MKKCGKRIIIWGAALALLLVIARVAFALFYGPKRQEPITAEWKTGDVFFSVGDSWKSAVVRSLTRFSGTEVTDSTPSHCGIIILEKDGPKLIHESTDRGKLVSESPEEFLVNNGALCVYNRSVPFEIDTIKLITDIKKLLKEEKPFDHNFDHHNPDAFYCTEFVVAVLEQNGCDSISQLRFQKYIYPQDLLDMMENHNR